MVQTLTEQFDLFNSPVALLDTLAQLGTSPISCGFGEDDFDLNKATSLVDSPALLKRARAKYMSTAVSLRLASVQSPLAKRYWNSYYCCETLEVRGALVSSQYCKNRWCLVCNRIRTAQLINKYFPQLSQWQEKQFVSLTVPNVKKQFLNVTIKRMFAEFKRIQEKMKKQDQRGTGSKLVGLRKFEITYNQSRNDYHPHFHIVTQDLVMAQVLRDEWLNRFPAANSLGQDIRSADNNTLMEMFKYFTKIITKSENGKTINPVTLDVIFQAIVKIRIFQTFGFVSVKVEPDPEEIAQMTRLEKFCLEQIDYTWFQEFHDWISLDGHCLTEYEPSQKMQKLVE